MNISETVEIGNMELKVKIADTPALRELGLQNVEKIEGYDGMLFIFQEKGILSFWNKNTLLDLDVVWIADNEIISVEILPRESERGRIMISSPVEVNMVLELPKGRASELGIIAGTSVSLAPALQ